MFDELKEAFGDLERQLKGLSTEMHKGGLLADDIIKTLTGTMGRHENNIAEERHE